MSRSQINLQDAFLNHVRKEKIAVTINITGGGKIDGLVKGFDNFVILVKHEGQHLIYKHAINSIIPERAVELVGHTSHTEPEARAAEPVKAPVSAISPIPQEVGPETAAIPPGENEEPWVEG